MNIRIQSEVHCSVEAFGVSLVYFDYFQAKIAHYMGAWTLMQTTGRLNETLFNPQ